MKYAVCVDSTVYLSEEVLKENGIKRASLNVIDKDETFKELKIDNQFVYSRLEAGHKLTTSQPSPVEFHEIYEEYLKDGVDLIFVVTLAPPLSGTYQSAVLAKKMLDDPEKVHIFESKMAAFGNEMVVLEMLEMIKANKGKDEIIERVQKLFDTCELVLTVEELTHLYRSGRLSKAKLMVGKVLRVKPIIKMVKGKLDMYKAARTHKKVLEAILEHMEKTTQNAKRIIVRVQSQNSLENTKMIRDAIEKRFKNLKVTFNDYLGPVFSLHVGPKGYGVAWCTE